MTQGTVIVELAPSIWTAVSVSSKPPVETPIRRPQEREIIMTMGKHIESLREAYNDLVGGEVPAKVGEQRSLFSPRRKKKQ